MKKHLIQMKILSEGQLGKIAMAKKSVEKTNILEELQANYSLKRKEDFEYGTVHTYCCKFNKKKRYLPCMHQYKVIFPSDSLEVIVQVANIHEYILNPDFVDTAQECHLGLLLKPVLGCVMNGVWRITHFWMLNEEKIYFQSWMD